MKKPWTDRFGDFMAGKGFYIVLFLCVAAIGVSGYYLFSSLAGDGPNAAVTGTAEVVIAPSVTPSSNMPNQPSSPAPTPVKPSVSPNKPSPSPSPSASVAPTTSAAPSPNAPNNASNNAKASVATVFTWPVKGDVIDAFSPDRQRYDVTMDDWRTHAGIDIAAELGTQVKAAAKGTVLSITDDPLMGTVLTIDHGGNVVSVYANLSKLPTVNVGDSVGVGDVIGAIGSTAIAESEQATHLHLAFLKNGSPADPLKYLPTQQ